MNKKIFNHKNLRLFVGSILLLLVIVILTYAFRVQIDPSSSDELANFATYFSGLITPVITLFSVLALVLTLRLQQVQMKQQNKQFKKSLNIQIGEHEAQSRRAVLQHNLVRLQVYLEKFELQLKLFEETSSKPFAYINGAVILKNYIYTAVDSEGFMPLREQLQEIEIIMAGDEDKLNSDQLMKKYFCITLKGHVENALLALQFAYRFATQDDAILLNTIRAKGEEMIDALNTWNIISQDKKNNLYTMIAIPPHIKSGLIFERVEE